MRTACAQMRTDVGAHPHRSIYNSSPTISYCAHRMRTECAPPFYSVRICAHSVRMRTTTIFCAQCAQPLRTAILCCAHSVRILCAFCAHAHRRRCACAPTLAVRILCALRTDVCGSFTPYLCAAHRLRTDAHRLSTLLNYFTLYLQNMLLKRNMNLHLYGTLSLFAHVCFLVFIQYFHMAKMRKKCTKASSILF